MMDQKVSRREKVNTGLDPNSLKQKGDEGQGIEGQERRGWTSDLAAFAICVEKG